MAQTANLRREAALNTTSTQTPQQMAKGWLHGVHMGNIDRGVASDGSDVNTVVAQNIATMQAMEVWQGSQFGCFMDFSTNATWKGIEGVDAKYKAFKIASDAGYVPVMSIATLPTNLYPGTDYNNNIRDAAAGLYNAKYAAVANRIIANGLGNRRIIMRVNLEFNGNNTYSPFQDFRSYTAGDTAGGYAHNPSFAEYVASGKTDYSKFKQGAEEWKQMWRNFVDTIRNTLRTAGYNPYAIEFSWAPNLGHIAGGIPSTMAYPGRGYVDYIGADFYDTAVGAPYYVNGAVVTGATLTAAQQTVWNNKKNGQMGLDFIAKFARAEGLLIGIGEWSISNQVEGISSGAGTPTGGQDNPYFIQQVNKFFWDNADVMGYDINYCLYVNRAGEVNSDFRVFAPSGASPALAAPNASAMYQSLTWPTNHNGIIVPGGTSAAGIVGSIVTPNV